MIIRHNLPHKAYTKVDKHVFTHSKLTDGAKVLYGYLCGLRNGAAFSDKYIMKALGVSQTVITRRKKELKDANLIMIDQIAANVYVIYIGHTKMTAQQVKESWKTEDSHL